VSANEQPESRGH
nr:immunoglobulin heavy chain junction region [Homo sapiens]